MPKKKTRKRNKPASAAQLAGLEKARRARKRKAQQRAREKAELGLTYDAVMQADPGMERWREEYKYERNIDPTGFLQRILNGEFEIKLRTASGEGRGGVGTFVPRAHQRKIYHDIVEHRRNKDHRMLEAWVKSRQIGASTAWDTFIWGDSLSNPGMSSVVTAHQRKTLMALQQNFRWFAGRDKTQGRAKRISDELFETPEGSAVSLAMAGGELGRGDSVTHVHVSEADYIEDMDDALDSVLGSMIKAPWATCVLESTIRRGSATEFKYWLEELTDPAYKGDAEGIWNVRFMGWMDDESAFKTMTPAQTRKFMESIESADNQTRDYERWLRDKMKATPEQIRWWRSMYHEDGRRSLIRTQELYPTTLDEALRLVAGAPYFEKDALAFLRRLRRPPICAYYASYDGLKLVTNPHGPYVEIWHQPAPTKRYVVGVDTADADQRQQDEVGSENFIVVLDLDTGDQVAQWHGFTNSQETAVAAWRIAQHYNTALIVPEVPPGGSGVVDLLLNQFNYGNVYQREVFGQTITTMQNVYGFNTRTGSRGVITGRLQDNINSKSMRIYSEYLYDQIVEFGKRKGKPLRKGKSRPGEKLDDGCMALALCMAGHDNAINGMWQPKDGIDLEPTAREEVITNADRAKRARDAAYERMLEDDDWGVTEEEVEAFLFMET